jgi:hypothetical protein
MKKGARRRPLSIEIATPLTVAESQKIAVAVAPDPLGRDEGAHHRVEMVADDEGRERRI